MEIDGDAFEVEQTALVDDNGHTMHLECGIELGVDFRVEVQLVLEAGASSTDDTEP